MGFDGEESLAVTVQVQPMTRVTIGTLQRLEPHEAAGMKISFGWSFSPLDKAAFEEADAEKRQAIRDVADKMEEHGILASQLGSAAAVLEQLAANGLDNFVDTEFMPNDAALYNDPENEVTSAPVVWRRPTEFLKKKPKVFAGKVQPGDVAQGALGDCWFLASLSALAEFPMLIRRCFVTQAYVEQGVYEITCFKNGRVTKVVLDDYFPCNPTTGKPCYSKAKRNELWVLLLEKAWAKIHGSYEQIEGGVAATAMMDMTGATSRAFPFTTEDAVANIESGHWFKKIQGYAKHQFLMVAGSPGKDNLTKAEDDRPSGGIVPGHAYTLLDAIEVNGIRLLNLRNPWGQFEWQGDWSDKSDLWTDELLEICKPTRDTDDGKFWMNDTDFFRNFSDLSVVFSRGHVGEAWETIRTEIETPKQQFDDQVLEFIVDQPSLGYAALVQQDTRIRGTPDYINLSFAIYGPCDEETGMPKAELVRSSRWATRALVERLNDGNEENPGPMMPGKYVAVVFNPDQAERVKAQLVVQLVDKHTCDEQQAAIVPLTLEMRRELVWCTAVHSDDSSVSDYGSFETSACWLPNGGYAIAAKNKGGTAIELTMDYSGCTGFVVQGTDEMAATVTLEPKDGMQLVSELIPEGDEKSVSFSLSYREL
jgi:hypothetical protein